VRTCLLQLKHNRKADYIRIGSRSQVNFISDIIILNILDLNTEVINLRSDNNITTTTTTTTTTMSLILSLNALAPVTQEQKHLLDNGIQETKLSQPSHRDS